MPIMTVPINNLLAHPTCDAPRPEEMQDLQQNIFMPNSKNLPTVINKKGIGVKSFDKGYKYRLGQNTIIKRLDNHIESSFE